MATNDTVFKEFRESLELLAKSVDSMLQSSCLLAYGRDWQSVLTDVKSQMERHLSDPTAPIPEVPLLLLQEDEGGGAVIELKQAIWAASESCVRLQLVYEKLSEASTNGSPSVWNP